MNSIAIYSPIAKQIVVRIIERAELEKLQVSERHVLNTDIVPKISEKLMPDELKESILPPSNKELPAPALLQVTVNRPSVRPNSRIIPRQASPLLYPRQNPVNENDYGKLTIFLNNPSISYIECFGANIPLGVINHGQSQTTSVQMTEDEIKNFIAVISRKSRIPIIEGVFRVVAEDFIINAVVSETVGTKFIIKKNFQLPQEVMGSPNRRFY